MTRTTFALIALFALIAACCVAFGAYFSFVTLQNAHRAAMEERFALAAQRVASTAELAASLGIQLPSQSTLSDLLRREAGGEPKILSMDVVDERGVVLFSSDGARAGGAESVGAGGRVSRRIENDLGAAIGKVTARYDQAALAAGGAALAQDLQGIAVPTLGAAFLATVLIGLMLASGLRRAARRAADPKTWPPAARAALAAAEDAERQAVGRRAAQGDAAPAGGAS